MNWLLKLKNNMKEKELIREKHKLTLLQEEKDLIELIEETKNKQKVINNDRSKRPLNRRTEQRYKEVN